MAKYLTTVTEIYRVDSETEVELLLDEAKHANYTLEKYSSQYKEAKQKGEVIDSWFKVTLVKSFNDEKNPCDEVMIKYE